MTNQAAVINRNPSPKTKFLKYPKDLIAGHVKMVESAEFELTCNVALLEYQRQLSNQQANDLGSCASLHLRLLGAQEIIGIMLNLTETGASLPDPVLKTSLSTNQPRK